MIGNSNLDTRKNIKKNAKKGGLIVNGEVEKNPARQVDPKVDQVYYLGEYVEYFENIYLMMNKPKGYLSSTNDPDPTVMDLLDDFYLTLDLSIVGRLDRDTTGLLLLTTDGKFNHLVTSPKSDIKKTYLVETMKEIDPSLVQEFKNGVYIKEEDYTARPADLKILGEKRAQVQVTEGKFHLVKRLFEAFDNEVVDLRRSQIGELKLDESLKEGDYRELSEAELDSFGFSN